MQAGLALTALAAVPAHAQTPAPSPTPTPSVPIYNLPGVTPERFSIGPAPTPSPTPVPTPTATRAPAVRPTPTATPLARAALGATPIVQATPTPTPAVAAPPLASPTIVALPSVPAPQPGDSQRSPWFWALLGAGATALAGLAGWLLLRRSEPAYEDCDEPVAAVAPPAPPPPPPPPAPAPTEPVAAVAVEPFEITVSPVRIDVTETEAVIELELLIANLQDAPAENIRLALAIVSARPEQDVVSAGFHAQPSEPVGAPFDLQPGAGGRIPVRLSLPRERIHVVEVAGRPMFVPMLMVELRWRGGLSLKRFGADFMLGTAGQGGKLGPIWLDRGQPQVRLAATRYITRAAAAG